MSNRRYNAQTRTKLYGGGSPSAMKKLQQMLAAQSGKKKNKKTAKPSMIAMAMKGKR
jgi:hypothetical protein